MLDIGSKRAQLLKFAMVGCGLFAGPGILFTLPYLLPQEEYAGFAKVLAVSQLIATIITAGLEIACPRLKVSMSQAAKFVLFNALIVAAPAFFIIGGLTKWQIFLAFAAAIANTISGIWQSYFLFSGDSRLYGLWGMGRAVVIVGLIFASVALGVRAEIVWTISSIGGFAVMAFCLFGNGREFEKGAQLPWLDIYKFGLPMAIIYGASTIPFVMDRVVAQSFLSVGDFSRYGVAVTWAIPIIYLGNIFQQYMVGSNFEGSTEVLARFFFGILTASTAYCLSVIGLVWLGCRIPYFESGMDFFDVWGAVAGWYFLYSAIAFPCAAIIQKRFERAVSVKLSIVSLLMLPATYCFSWLLSREALNCLGIYSAVLFAFLYAFSMLMPRVYFVCKFLLRKHNYCS